MRTGLRLNARVVCTDGPAGHLTDVIRNPSTERVSHLVVELKGFGHFQHLVPVSLVQASADHCVSLRCTLAELANSEFFTETEPVPVDASTACMMAMR